MEHGKKKMVYGGMPRTQKAGGGMYDDDIKRMKKNMGGVANTQPMYSEAMPKAMAN